MHPVHVDRRGGGGGGQAHHLAEFDEQGEEDGAGEGLGLGDVAGYVLQQAEAEVLLDGRHEAVGVAEHGAAVLQQDLQQLQGQQLQDLWNQAFLQNVLLRNSGASACVAASWRFLGAEQG